MREGIKEAIEFLDHMANSFKCISSLNCKSIDKKKNEIVAILEQGEAYRQIALIKEEQIKLDFKKIISMYLNKYIDCKISYSPEDYDIKILTHRLLVVLRKYFPKEVKP